MTAVQRPTPASNTSPESPMQVPFNKPYVTGAELGYIQQAIENSHLGGNGPFSGQCTERLTDLLGSPVLLTHSCTGALELIALLANIREGDEVIVPSYTFTTTASAFVLRGATPVFVDVREDTLNIDPVRVEAAITERTRAIVAVHYAGVACDMADLAALANRADAILVEDAAQGFAADWHGTPLGTIGALGAISFHETKNIISGEGGALVINDPELLERAEILQEKGTNRRAFFRGKVDKYSWVDIGSSFVPSEMMAAFLWAQLEQADSITAERLRVWDLYHSGLADLEQAGLLRRPVVPAGARHNAHMYYLLLPSGDARDQAMTELAALGVTTVFHYVPLHSAPAGRRYGRTAGSLEVTDDVSARLLRLPLWVGMNGAEVTHVIDSVRRVVGQ
jgi:dTDP-4-amino-4,6-dideoxygalactose transaminase